MTEPREKSDREKGVLGETVKTHLVDKFVSVKYGRETEIENKYVNKGLSVEEDSITLYSRLKKSVFRKNEEQLSNEFICGTPDLYTGKEIRKTKVIIDTKSSWDIFTFHRARIKTAAKSYYWQLQGYMDLTGAETAILAYCLIDTPSTLIFDEKRKLQWKMGVINPEKDLLYLEACSQIDKNMTYGDIPMEERMFEITIQRNDADIQRLHDRVIKCREYMQKHFFANELVAA